MENATLSFDVHHPQPLLVVISGPSGVGKDAVVKELQRRGQPFHFVVTMASREPRQGEINGQDYWFTTKENFERLIAEGEFIEYAMVYQEYKGIPKTQIRDAMASNKDVILRVDVQGAATLRRLYPDALLIYLIPANEDEWLERLRSRKTETPESLKLRIETARSELEHLSRFDYVVVNADDKLDEAVDTIIAIIKAEHHKVHPRKAVI